MTLRHGDYTALASEYARHRPGYAPGVPDELLRFVARAEHGAARTLELVDVGAGTGIWTRMLARSGHPTTAIEPNEAMLEQGRRASAGTHIAWRRGCAEDTGLPSASCDLVTMASSFHWADFERASAELARVLRPGGVLAALWNTRLIEESPLQLEIEAELERRVPHLERVSSGRSAFCESLTPRLTACGRFAAVGYFEERHLEHLSPERYLGIWRSVNDVRVQAGEQVFAEFLGFVAARTAHLSSIPAAYRTRVWTARVPGGSPGRGSP